VSLVTDQNYTRTEAARSLGINANMLGSWVKEHQSDDGQAFRGNGKLTPEQEELRNLRIQVKWLQMEKDILKSDGFLCSPSKAKYLFTAQNKNIWPISLQCQVLGITRSGYYSYQARLESRPDDPRHQEMIDWVSQNAWPCYLDRKLD